jgi:hypothetical protein
VKLFKKEKHFLEKAGTSFVGSYVAARLNRVPLKHLGLSTLDLGIAKKYLSKQTPSCTQFPMDRQGRFAQLPACGKESKTPAGASVSDYLLRFTYPTNQPWFALPQSKNHSLTFIARVRAYLGTDTKPLSEQTRGYDSPLQLVTGQFQRGEPDGSSLLK